MKTALFPAGSRRLVSESSIRRLWKWLPGLLMAVGAASAQAQTVEYIHTDALGTPVAVTNSAGVVIERSEYEPYGKLLNRPLTDGPGFTGHVQDAATGLTYMQQRYYDPGIGKMLSVDPVSANANTGAGFCRYCYAANNPYRFTDPDGRQERAAENFGQAYPSMTPAEKAPLEAVAIQATATAVAMTPVVGPVLALSFRQVVRNAESSAPKGDPHAPGDAPNGTVIVRGGTGEMPAPGTTFSGSQGGTVTEAGAGVPHGTIRTSTAGEIRSGGGRVEVAPEPTRSGQVNGQHVNVTEGGKTSTFSPPQPNPAPKVDRIK